MIASVFLGPSIALQEARAILPKAIFHPPASQGDLLSAIDQDGAEILGLIDGTFHQNLSVWHNEVCYLLSRGVAVYGASSMGALRAVETEKFGAIGVGCIYRWYRDGVITGDDEVALVHGDEDSDFRPLSLPLVNIRASMSLAIWNGLLDRLVAEQVINIAKSLYYPDRQVPAILQICREKGVGLDQVIATERALTINYVDLKRADAQEMLMVLARVLDGSVQTPKPPQFEFLRSSVFETLYNLDRKVRIEGNDISMQSIAEHVALHCTDFKEIKRSALDRALVVFLGSLLDIHVTRDEVIKERDVFCEERALNSPDSLSAWLRCNALCERDFWELLTKEAMCRRLRRSGLTVRSFDRGCKILLDELRLRGTFPHWAHETSEEAAIVTTYQEQPEYGHVSSAQPQRLAAEHAARCNVYIKGDARIWAEDAGFDGVEGLIEALRRSTVFEDVRNRIARQLEVITKVMAALSTNDSNGDDTYCED